MDKTATDSKPPTPPLTLPFGRHQGEPLSQVPLGYLQWLLRDCKLSSGLRRAVAEGLARRGLLAPPPRSTPTPVCQRCGPGKIIYTWIQDRRCQRRIRRCCARCRRSLGFAPHQPTYTAMADAATSPTGVLDVLQQCEALGIDLKSDGVVARFATDEDRLRAAPALLDLVAQSRGTLGRLLGKREVPQ